MVEVGTPFGNVTADLVRDPKNASVLLTACGRAGH